MIQAYETVGKMDGGQWRTFARMLCRNCGAKGEIGVSDKLSARSVLKLFRRAGWSAARPNSTNCTCPACIAGRKEPAKMIAIVPPPPPRDGSAVKPPPAPPAAPAPAAPSPKLSRAVFAMLEDHFDEQRGAYRDGWNDDRVAAETGASPAFVSALRNEAFGPLKDPEIDAIRRDLDELNRRITNTRSGIAERHDRAVADLDTLVDMAAKLSGRLDAVESRRTGAR